MVAGHLLAAFGAFLSTPSARRATFNKAFEGQHPTYISIHALREEGDRPRASKSQQGQVFLSTPSARRATCRLRQRQDWETHFYPRPPRGGRQGNTAALSVTTIFLSTPSARRATSCRLVHLFRAASISIHALREEGDTSESGVNIDQTISIHALREEGDVVRDGPMLFCC